MVAVIAGVVSTSAFVVVTLVTVAVASIRKAKKGQVSVSPKGDSEAPNADMVVADAVANVKNKDNI